MTGSWLEQALGARLHMWRDAFALIAWSPLFGVGAGAFDGAIEDCKFWLAQVEAAEPTQAGAEEHPPLRVVPSEG